MLKPTSEAGFAIHLLAAVACAATTGILAAGILLTPWVTNGVFADPDGPAQTLVPLGAGAVLGAVHAALARPLTSLAAAGLCCAAGYTVALGRGLPGLFEIELILSSFGTAMGAIILLTVQWVAP